MKTETKRAKEVIYTCSHCGSEDVLSDAWAAWNPETQEMELESVFDQAHCQECDGECSVKEVPFSGQRKGAYLANKWRDRQKNIILGGVTVEGYTLIREFIYGYDFTLFGNQGEILILTKYEIEKEIEDEKSAYKNQELEGKYGEDLYAANCRREGDKVTATIMGKTLICKGTHDSQK